MHVGRCRSLLLCPRDNTGVRAWQMEHESEVGSTPPYLLDCFETLMPDDVLRYCLVKRTSGDMIASSSR